MPAITMPRLIISPPLDGRKRAALANRPPEFQRTLAGELLLGFFPGCIHRTGILTLGLGIAIHELDEGHRRVVAMPKAGLQHAGIAARAIGVAWANHLEQLLNLR